MTSTPSGSTTRALDLRTFPLGDMLRCGLELRRGARDAKTMEEAAQAIVRYLYDAFQEPGTGERSCPLVRFYRTHSYGALDEELQAAARGSMGQAAPGPDMRCLTLLASAGAEPAWNDRRQSRNHRAIPLPTRDVVERAPMIAQLIKQLGLDVSAVVAPSPALLKSLEGKTYNVFHVERALGSPYIPAQRDFVQRYGIESVVGFGGLANDDLFAVVLFSKVPISSDVANRFRNVALDVKSVIFAFAADEVFEPRA